jgi:two-component system, chemotaxis family, chemotaxis protein CheY
MKAMLVEDAKGMRKLLRTMLRKIGFDDVVEAEDGKQAWDALRQQPVDLLLTDWNMPVMDGIQLVEKVRSIPDFEELPVLMFTARSGKEDVVRALQAGVDTYITKPFTPQQLKIKIRSIMGRRSQRQVVEIINRQDSAKLDAENPLVIFGENAVTLQQLSNADNREVMRFLSRAVGCLNSINALSSDLRLGYLLENSTSDITKRMRMLHDRVKMLMLSPGLPGGGVTLARLASINRRSNLVVFIVCESRNEIPTKARFGLEHLGINIFERTSVDAEALEQLINEYVVAPMREGSPSELPTPEEIRQRLENDIRTMVTLPVLPQVYHQIVALDRDRESDIQDWIEAIEADPLSRAQVIRRSRSPIYGFQGEINETSKAVILLGKNAVKEIIVAGTVRRTFEGVEEDGFNIDEYWFHSVGVALTARLLNFPLDENTWTPEQRKDAEDFQLSEEQTEALKKVNLSGRLALKPEQDPFIGGMMHDIGKVALIQGYPGLFKMIVDDLTMKAWNSPMRFAEETVAGGADHSLVGRILAQSWKLGNDLTQIVELHHNPGAEDHFAQFVAMANFIGGGIYAYPKQAAFPMTKLLQEEGEAVAPEGDGKSPEAETTEESQEGEKVVNPLDAPTDPLESARLFLPEGLLERLEIELGDLIDLGRLIAPTVRRLAEDLHKSI